MNEFKYRVSVVVPIYNVEKYLRDCLNSLVQQTMPFEDMEVLLINDGSTDDSLSICQEYASMFPVFKVHSKENEGFSATRNYGIEHATGKYLMFLDSDDMFAPNTIKSVADFFDSVYEQVDAVCYLDQAYKDGKKMPLHFRYNYMKKSGIYDLNECPFITQTRISVAVKNLFERNVIFPVDEKVGHEDQRYLNDILQSKMKIGYCSEGEYMYNRSNETSIMHEKFYPLYLFENTMEYYEKLFGSFAGEVPSYFQAYYMHDLSWKLKENILMPYHLQGAEYERGVERMKKLLDRVDDEIILTCPSTDDFHRHFFMNWKSDHEKCCVIAKPGEINVIKNEKVLLQETEFEVCLYKMVVEQGNIKVIAFVKSALFNYCDKPNLSVLVTQKDGNVKNIELELKVSSESHYKSKVKTNNFWQFCLEYPLDDIKSFEFKLEIDGFYYPTKYWFAQTAPFSRTKRIWESIDKDYLIKFDKNHFYVTKLLTSEIKELRNRTTQKYVANKEVYITRYSADMLSTKRIWLYYDCVGVSKDNGWFQFVHDIEQQDGIERYYINANVGAVFAEEYKNNIVEYGSMRHKALFVAAEKIITAFIETENFCPFSPDERGFYADIAHAQIIYLQHGILHAHLPWKYSPARVEADKIMISSGFERKNFVETYKFREKDLIPIGMERFDFLDKNTPTVRRILFAPSWRNYLIGSKTGNLWNYTDAKFIKSDYFINLQNFLNDERLEKLLIEKDLYLDFKIHPIFVHYLEHFNISNSRVKIVGSEVKDDEYAMYITDFSSYVFNFAYLGKNILYFIPDYIQFISGMNQYRELDLPFDEAFGPWVTNAEDALLEVEKAINNNFVPEEKYQKRMQDFYLPMGNNCERMYQYLINLK